MSNDLAWLDRILERNPVGTKPEETVDALATAVYEHTFELRRVRAMVAVLCKTLVDRGLVGEHELMRALIDAVHAAEAGMLDPDAPKPREAPAEADEEVPVVASGGGDPYRGAAPPILGDKERR